MTTERTTATHPRALVIIIVLFVLSEAMALLQPDRRLTLMLSSGPKMLLKNHFIAPRLLR